jgi:hypothetical protein
MQLLSWLRRRMTGRPQTRRTPARKPTPRFRPRVEALEGRDVPSTLTVLNNLDSGAGSLRADIAAAQAGDTIVFDPSLAGQTITLTSGELALDKSLTIQGPGAGQLTISGGNTSRVFDVSGAGTNVSLSGLTITGGTGTGSLDSGNGGGILNYGSTLTVSGCTLSHNGADVGGGIFNDSGTLTVSGCTLSNNYADSNGGGLGNIFGTVNVSNSTVSNNRTSTGSTSFTGIGGGLDNYTGGTMTVTNSTLSGNSADLGGGIANRSTLTVSGCTLSGNTARLDGGALYNLGFMFPATMTVTNSTLSNNTAYDAGSGIYSQGGGNLVTVNGCTFSANFREHDIWNGATNASTLTISNSTFDPGYGDHIIGPWTNGRHNKGL